MKPTEAVDKAAVIRREHAEKLAAIRAKYAQRATDIQEAQAGRLSRDAVLIVEAEKLGKARDVASRAVGLSVYMLQHAEEIVQAAADDPQRFGDLPQQMDDTGRIGEVYKEFKRRRIAGSHGSKQTISVARGEKAVEAAIIALEGLVRGLSMVVNAEGIDRSKAAAYANSIMKATGEIRRFVRKLR